MMGLLDFANTDDGMQGLGLLGAAAPSMAPMNFAGRLAMAAKGYQGMKDDMLKQQEAAQQFQIKNIALQQQQQEWAMQMPLLKLMSDKLQGNAVPQAVPAEAQQLPVMTPYSAAPRDMLSGDPIPRSQPMPQASQPSSAPQGGSMFPGVPDNVALPVAAFGGMKSLLPILTKYNEPTELVKQMVAAGIDPNSSQGRQTILDSIRKTNYIAPTRLGEGAFARPDGTIEGLPSAAPKGFINVRGPDGNWLTQQVAGGLDAVTAASAAEARGPATQTPEKVYNPKTKQFEFQTKANIADAANGVQPGRVTEGNIRDYANVGSILPTPATPADLAGIDAELKKPLNANQRQILTNARASVVAELNAKQPNATAPASGPMAAEPSLGDTANADAAQKASADLMQNIHTKLSAGTAASGAAINAIDRMLDLSNKKWAVQAGPLGTGLTSISPEAAEYEKQRANLVAQLSQQNGTGGTDAGRALTGESVPDYGKPKSAQQDGLKTLRNQVVAQKLKSDLLTPLYTAGESKKYIDLSNQFDQNVTPAIVPLLTMPAGPSRALLLKNAIKDPQTKARLNWAAENGLLK